MTFLLSNPLADTIFALVFVAWVIGMLWLAKVDRGY